MHIAEVVTIAKSLPLLRLNTYKSLILSYSADYRRIFWKKTIDKLGLSNLRIYANIQNLLTITGYDGYDPEIGASTSSVNVYGLDNGRYPSPTVYSFGLNVSF